MVIIAALNQAAAGIKVRDHCRKHGVDILQVAREVWRPQTIGGAASEPA